MTMDEAVTSGLLMLDKLDAAFTYMHKNYREMFRRRFFMRKQAMRIELGWNCKKAGKLIWQSNYYDASAKCWSPQFTATRPKNNENVVVVGQVSGWKLSPIVLTELTVYGVDIRINVVWWVRPLMPMTGNIVRFFLDN